MLTIAPATEGSWMLAEALLRCDRARERLETAIAGLTGLEEEMPWQANAIAALRAQLAQHAQDLRTVLHGLGDIESALLR